MRACAVPDGTRGIIFDMDGTLLDTVQLVSSAWEFALRSLGYSVTASEIEPFIGLPASKIAEAFAGGSSSLVELTNLRASYLEAHAHEVRAFPDVPPALGRIKGAGLKVAVATSIPSRMARLFLESAGILGHVDALVGGDEVERGKPEPDIFLEAAKRLALGAKELVIVGDRDYDIIPAKRIGSFSVLVVRRFYCPSERPDAVVGDLGGLLDLLGIRRAGRTTA